MDTRDDFYLPEDVLEWISLKKSEYLSVLIEKVKSSDFGFEEFQRFDYLIPGTIEVPDSIYEKEEDSYLVRTYIRSYQEDLFFHQLVIGLIILDQENVPVFVPIITFVTKDSELVRNFSFGHLVNKIIRN